MQNSGSGQGKAKANRLCNPPNYVKIRKLVDTLGDTLGEAEVRTFRDILGDMDV